MEKIENFYVYNATIVKVYDGDSYTAIIDLGFKIKAEIKLNLLNVDVPELRGEELKEGRHVRDIVREMILGEEVVIKTQKANKAEDNRYLAEIFIGGVNLGTWLLENGYGESRV